MADDLTDRLHAVTLTQEEQARLVKLKHARASVESNPELTASERAMLLGQLDSGINQLERRRRP